MRKHTQNHFAIFTRSQTTNIQWQVIQHHQEHHVFQYVLMHLHALEDKKR
jgi:hypothetical protein